MLTGSCPTPSPPSFEPVTPTLELLWQDDASAYAFARMADGSLSAGGLHLGMPAVADVAHAGHGISARRLELDELLALEADPPPGVEQGGTARVAFAVLDVARRSVADGLVHPHLQAADGRWHALWGATLDDHVRAELDAIAHAAARRVGRGVRRRHARRSSTTSTDVPSTSSRGAPCATRASGCRSPRRESPARPSTSSRGSPLRGRSCRPAPVTRRSSGASPPGSTAASRVARARRGTSGCASTRATAGRRRRRGRAAGRARAVARGGRRPDPRPARVAADGRRRRGVRLPARERPAARPRPPARDDRARPRRRGHRPRRRPPVAGGARPRAGARVPPAGHASSRGARRAGAAPPRVGRIVEPRPRQPRRDRVAGDLQRAPDAGRDRVLRLAPCDRGRRAHGGGAARARGREGAADPPARQVARASRSEVERALRFLDSRSRAAGVVELVRAVAGLETDEAGVELGEIRLDESLDELLAGAASGASGPSRRPPACAHDLFPFQERGHGWLRLLGDLGSAGSWPTTWASARRCRRSRPSCPSGRMPAPRRSARRSSSAR